MAACVVFICFVSKLADKSGVLSLSKLEYGTVSSSKAELPVLNPVKVIVAAFLLFFAKLFSTVAEELVKVPDVPYMHHRG